MLGTCFVTERTVGLLLTNIGFRGPLYYNYKEPHKQHSVLFCADCSAFIQARPKFVLKVNSGETWVAGEAPPPVVSANSARWLDAGLPSTSGRCSS